MTARSQLTLVAVLVAACFLPGEPSGPARVTFVLDFTQPYRVPLAGGVQPLVKITADGQALTAPNYHLESLDPGVVRVDPTGRGLEGVTRGTASVRVVYETATGAPDTTFTVRAVVSRTAVSSASLAFTRLADTSRLTATAYDAKDAAVPSVKFTWSSAEPHVASVDTAGLVRALNEGTVVITAEADSVTGSSSVSVTQVAAAVRMVPKLDTLRTLSRSTRFLAVALDDTNGVVRTAKPHWSSSDEHVARIDTTGLATATGAGTAKIIARVGTAADTALLVVAQVVASLVIKPSFDTLTAITDTVRHTVVGFDSLHFAIPQPRVAWSSGDTGIVTVDATGLVRAAKNGVVLVTASAAGQSAFATVVVRQQVTAAQVSPHSVTLAAAGDTVRLGVVGLDRNGYPVPGAPFNWRAGTQCVATVDAGFVTARGGGETAAIVTPVNGGRSDTAVVTVRGAPSAPEIAFVAPGKGIEGLCADGSGQVLLVSNGNAPSWSPDGARIAFSQLRVTSDCQGGIFIAKADGSEPRPVTSGCDLDVAWSPDGRMIAFTRVQFMKCEQVWGCAAIYVANADGTNAHRLGGGDSTNVWMSPSWEPSGARLAFTRYLPARPASSEIAFVNVDGTSFTPTGVAGASPKWSPDGSQIAFVYGGIYLMNADRTGVTLLVGAGAVYGPEEGMRAVTYISAPAWSPDGTRLVFGLFKQCWDYGGTSYSPGHLEVVSKYSVPPGGSGWCDIAGWPGDNGLPDSPTWRRIPNTTLSAAPAPARTPARLRPSP